MKKTLLILTALCIFFTGYSQTFTDNFITYNVTSTSPNEVRITDYDNTGGVSVTIPATVTYNTVTYSVTRINSNAFVGNQVTGVVISSVSIPNTVTYIGEQAFAQNNLSSITLPTNLETIADYAFQSNQLSSITIPSSVTSIGEGAFRLNPLVSVTCVGITPPSITTASSPSDSFHISGDRSGIDLLIPAGTRAAYTTDTGALWTGFNTVTENVGVGDTYVDGYITYEITSINPDTAKAVNYDTNGGTSVNIPATVPNGIYNYSVTEIGDLAFKNKALTAVSLPNSLLVIGMQAFNTNSLSNITFPNGLTTIGQQAFGINSITSVTFPSSVTTIEQGAFVNNLLTSIVVPDNVTSLGDSAFENNNITTATLSNNITTIGNTLFNNNNLTTFTVGDNITSIGIGAFQNNQLTSVNLGNNVTDIGIGAFTHNQLTSVTIPASVTTIGNVAFNNNTTLTDVYAQSTTPPTINTTGNQYDSFSANRNTIHLHIPPGTMGAYVTNPGAQWTGFNPVTEDVLSNTDFEFKNSVKVISTLQSLTIKYTNAIKLEYAVLYNMLGQTVISTNKNDIPTTTLPKGIYILRLDFDKGIYTKKVLVR